MSQPQFQKVQHIHRERMGGQGRCAYRGEYGPDSIPLERLITDSKSRKTFPKHILEALETIVEQAMWPVEKLRHLNEDVEEIPEYRVGIVRYHVTGTKYDSDLIVLRAADFESWFL